LHVFVENTILKFNFQHVSASWGWRISETAMPCQADFLDFLFSFDKLLPSTSEWLAAGEAEAGSAGEQPAEE
jgi:hypothetical protein